MATSCKAKEVAMPTEGDGDLLGLVVAPGLGARIKELRRLLGLTQAEFAARARIARSYLSEVEGGKSKPSIEIVAAIAALHPVANLRYVLFGQGELAALAPDAVAISSATMLEALLIRAEREQAAVPPVLGARDLSNPEFRKWLAQQLYDQMKMLGNTPLTALIRTMDSADGIASLLDLRAGFRPRPEPKG